MWVYKSWDESYYVTNKYDVSYGLVKKLKGFKMIPNVVKYLGFKAAWAVASLRSTKELVVIS